MTSPAIQGELARTPAMSARQTGLWRRLGCAAAYLILCGFTLSPLLWVSVPRLVDYPNHLARMWILLNDGQIPELADNYVVHWRLLPNLAMDLVVPLLAHIVPIDVAGRIFVALTMLTLIGGTAALHRALHGRAGLWPLVSLLFIYNAALYWGFLNCLFGIGLYLLAFSGWVASRNWPLGRRLAVFSVVAGLIFVMHLFAFGLYGLSVCAYELEVRLGQRRSTLAALRSWIVTCVHFVPALTLWLVSSGGPSVTIFGRLSDKLYAILAFANFSDGTMILLDWVMVCGAYLALYCLIRSRSLILVPAMRLPLIVLGLTALLIPNWLNGSWAADIRLPVALPFVAIAATQIDIGWKWAGTFASVALTLLAVRVWSVTQTWRDYDGRVAEFRAAASIIRPSSRLLVVEASIPDADRAILGIPPALGMQSEPTYSHMPALAVIDRSAFMPYLFTGWTTVQPAQRNAGLFQAEGGPLSLPDLVRGKVANPEAVAQHATDHPSESPYWEDWPKKFDYVLWINFGRGTLSTLDNLEPVAVGSFFQIYRVVNLDREAD
jgi:hypothetical protein